MFSKDDAARAILVVVVAVLSAIGAIMIYSTCSRGQAPFLTNDFVRQMLYVLFGVSCAVILAAIDYHVLLRYHRVALLAAAILLALVLVPHIGSRINGARRWFRLGTISFQPSEFAKIAIILFLAAFLGRKDDDEVKSVTKALIPAVAALALIMGLTVVETDIGTTFLIGVVGWVMLFAAGSRTSFLVAPLIGGAATIFIAVSRLEYARDRISAWLDPWSDPSGAGYHIIQSLVAIGSGGTFGVGLGASNQKLQFLPESSTDYIFAIFAEEMGLIGVTAVIVLYAAFVWCGITIARRAADRAGMLLAVGITSLIAAQALINIGVVSNVLPPKGIPLPLISAGGSSVVFMFMAIGILYNVARGSSYAAGRMRVEECL